jgi:hypothetical protein
VLIIVAVFAALILAYLWTAPVATYRGQGSDCIGTFSLQCTNGMLEMNFSTTRAIESDDYSALIDGRQITGELRLLQHEGGDVDVFYYSFIGTSPIGEGQHRMTFVSGNCNRPLSEDLKCQ